MWFKFSEMKKGNHFLGYIDEVSETCVRGWVINKGSSESVEVKLYINKKKITSSKADILRIGLKEKNLHPTGTCGFKIVFKERLTKNCSVQVLISENNQDLKNSPWTFEKNDTSSKKQNRFLGYIDEVREYYVRGWVIDKNSNNPVDVTLIVNNKKITSSKAKVLRKGLKEKNLHPTGYCGFNIVMEERLTENCSVQILISENSQDLRNSPWKFQKNNTPLKKLFLIHIPKTAGSSLNYFIQSNFTSNKSIVHLEQNKKWKSGQISRLVESNEFLSGHLSIKDVMKKLDISNYYKVAMLRNPLDQVVSHIKWVIGISNKTEGKFFKNHPKVYQDMSLKLRHLDLSKKENLEYFVNNMTFNESNLFTNCQTRYFLDSSTTSISVKDAEKAIKCFKNFDLIGTVDRYDDFIKFLCKQMSWKEPKVNRKLNTNNSNIGIDLSDHEVLTILKKLTWADEMLYEEARLHFESSFQSKFS